jgi:hypothetical protein
METLERRVRRLERVVLVLLVALAGAVAAGFRAGQPTAARELTAERINVVDSTGRPVLVLASGRRLPGAVIDGREYPQAWVGRGRIAGMIFYASNGDEVGGLVYDAARRDSGYAAVGHLSFDQWRQNQVVAVQYSDDGRSRRAGLLAWDRPTSVSIADQFELAARVDRARGAERDSLQRELARVRAAVAGVQRVFVGSQDRAAQLQLRDTRGRVRARLVVDSTDAARLEFLDEAGRVVAAYPR